VHGTNVVVHDGSIDPGTLPRADAVVAFEPDRVCAVMTADCLPVVFADRDGTRIAVAHAGWRGLAGGVLEATINALQIEPAKLVAWLGPAIGHDAFEVGPEVRAAFLRVDRLHDDAFTPNAAGCYQADLYRLARRTLAAAGVQDVSGGGWCTSGDTRRFFSHRRDAGSTGRMATLGWLERHA
jgi:YfiH family protein